MVGHFTFKITSIRIRLLCLISFLLVVTNIYADQYKKSVSDSKQSATSSNENLVIEKAISNVKNRCESQYSKLAIEGSRSRIPESQRDNFDLFLSIRKNSECQCLPAKLKSIDTAKLNLKNEKHLNTSLVHLIQPLLQDCVAESYKQQWAPFCDILMRSETDDVKKRSKACQCLQPTIDKVSNAELIAFSNQAYLNFKTGKKYVGPANSTKSTLEKASQTCIKQAGIDMNSNYKKNLAEQNIHESKVAKAKADMKVIASALFLYKLDFNQYPSQQQGLAILLQENKLPNSKKTRDPYLQKLPKDAWGHDYNYNISPDGNTVNLSSYGRDGKPGGTDFDQDILQEVK